MMDLLREWITSITAACFIISVAQVIVPEGSVEKILRFTGGLVIILVVTMPLLRLDAASIDDYLSQYRNEMERYEQDLLEENEDMMKAIVASESEAYLEQRVSQEGLSCTFEVYCAMSEEGYPIPYVVHIHGALSSEERLVVMQIILDDFGISANHQYYDEEHEQ